MSAFKTPQAIGHVRRLLMVGTLACAACLTWAYARIIAVHGINAAEVVALAAFFILALWVSLPFCSCLVGFWNMTRRGSKPRSTPLDELPQTAILVPIYNESPLAVFSAIAAMARSLERTGRHPRFEFFVLSDTQLEDVWRQEEAIWSETSALMPDGVPIYYRRRSKNHGRKAGNIADFVRRWGGRYELMIVLDADSVMEGETLVEMTARAAADETIGILQVPPKPVNRGSLLARILQFAADVYGPVYLAGYQSWTGSDGNYFGHNAVIRTAAFAKHCTLPVLPGAPPLGGHILSHDFVEAALIRRAGYQVVTADDLAGSYEECPTTLLDYAVRDQRWCQGNLQHSRLLAVRGLRPASRFHFLNGVLSYVSSVIWILFMVAMASGMLLERHLSGTKLTGAPALLFAVVFLMLLTPKFLSFLSLRSDPARASQLGGRVKVAMSMLLETGISILLAPVLAYYHASFVISATIFGRSVQWSTQSRDERVIPVRELVKLHLWQTLTGVAILAVSFAISPLTGLWCLPLSVGLMLSIPIAYALGSRSLGDWLRARGLLTIPEEIVRPEILRLRDAASEEISARLQATDRTDAIQNEADDDQLRTRQIDVLMPAVVSS
ncbi:MAG: glucans biosynthesis glucosyltransferase MdoH [Planctomycetaceae bacterium]|nr:glucans biosynthesis glucosyltransferase MdoH [Planctomycetaceae bacterium]